MSGKRGWNAFAVAIALIWFGAVLGHSFLATPAVFQSTHIARPVAFDVVRVSFALFSKAEWALWLAFGLGVLLSGRHVLAVAVLAALAAILILQAAWLLPALGVRADMVLAGKPLPASVHHAVQSSLELVKALLLLAFAAAGLRTLARK
ncbi:MAG: hypothetical protein AB7F96_14145 [Beijerinckiaceae bacterium]